MGGGGAVAGWVRDSGGSDNGRLDGVSSGSGVLRGRGGVDRDGSGVLAVLVDNDGGGGHDVGLGSDGDGGWLRALGGKTGDDLGGVLDGSRAGGVSGSRADDSVRVGGGGNGVGHSGGGLVLSRVAVGVGVGRGNKASDDSEGVHVDCWVDY